MIDLDNEPMRILYAHYYLELQEFVNHDQKPRYRHAGGRLKRTSIPVWRKKFYTETLSKQYFRDLAKQIEEKNIEKRAKAAAEDRARDGDNEGRAEVAAA